MKGEHIEPLDQFTKSLTYHLAPVHCPVLVLFGVQDINTAIENILKEKYEVTYEQIPLEKLMKLNQY